MNALVESTVMLDERMRLAPIADKLRREIEGDVLFDKASRGRYATDASIYQIEPLGVVVPRTQRDVEIAIQIAREEKLPVLPRGGGTSQCGQTVGACLVIDNTKYLRNVTHYEPGSAEIDVQPGVVLDQLNALLKPHGLWFPVDVSTSAQATLGGMAGNNSCGSRSIHYGNMVHNVAAIEALLYDGSVVDVGTLDEALASGNARLRDIAAQFRQIALREADEIRARFPRLLRRVAGYNLDILEPQDPLGYATPKPNLAHLLVGSEGTLAYFRRLRLKLSPLPRHKVLGVVHFPTFYQAMDLTRHIVTLAPQAVELVDRTMLELSLGNPIFAGVVKRFLVGQPDALLLVEFAGDEHANQLAKLKQLVALLGDLGLPGSVVEVADPALQKDIWEVRKAGLNIMMSMKGDGKPVSFIEDCCVPLEHLAEYTRSLSEVFEKHGTRGTWYAHASVGTLHVRPVLDMKIDGAAKMRAIAEEACALVKQYKGVYSGEHGDGLVRSEWIAPFFGPRLTAALGEIKALFDPLGMMNPGKIVNPPRQDNRALFRFKPGYATQPIDTVLDWRDHGGFAGAVEMCNNNGHCRKFDAGTMCPSYRATRDEQHLTRGRANSLRLAISGQLGANAFTSDALFDSMDLCVSCKGCKRECPTGVDMAKMKIEFLHHYKARHGHTLKDRLVAHLPRYAPIAARFPWFANLRDTLPGAAHASEKWIGLAAQRSLPRWRRDTFTRWLSRHTAPAGDANAGDVVLFADTFNNYFESENLIAAHRVLTRAGYRVHHARPDDDARSLCCGRTYLASGMVDEAKREAARTLAALLPYARRGVAIVGLEPSCILGMRDEFLRLDLGEDAETLARCALTFEEFIAHEAAARRFAPRLKPLSNHRALLHGHCHQKAFDVVKPIQAVLALIPDLQVELIESSCCGMAGSFGYEAAHFAASKAMAEASLLPAVRSASADTLLIADGTSCRQQIHDFAQREAVHVARVLDAALA